MLTPVILQRQRQFLESAFFMDKDFEDQPFYSTFYIILNIDLADSYFCLSQGIPLLFGAELYIKLRKSSHTSAHKTASALKNRVFGWIVRKEKDVSLYKIFEFPHASF